MPEVLQPATINALVEAVRSAPRVIVVGAETKPRLSAVDQSFVRISVGQLRGIVEYEPSEYTFTALAGTPIREIAATLAERGQYLPFDPMFVEAGATIGGTVAAGLSGAGRFRFGGLRDFILGVKFIDGSGQLLRLGGKVVKNAAGFDLPKFLVGSLGRYAVLAEITFKVFPRAAATRTLRIHVSDTAVKVRLLNAGGAARWELDAIDTAINEDTVALRLAGPEAALDALTNEILGRWPGVVLSDIDAKDWWAKASECRWAHPDGSLVRVALSTAQVPAFDAQVRTIRDARGWVGAGGNVGFLSLPAGTLPPALAWPALTLRGDARLWPGLAPRFEVMHAVKHALDPQNRFPGLDE